jgi:hypothetical protein
LPLQRKPDADNKYSSSDERLEINLDDISDDTFPEFEVETDESSLASLDACDPDDDTPIEPAPESWLIAVRALAREHGPFSAAQIAQTVHELSAPIDGCAR